MLNFFKKRIKPKNENSRRFKEEMAEHLAGRHIKYCTERVGDTDEIIGRDGCLSLRGDEFIVFSSGDIVMRTKVEEMKASELLSLEGAIITAPDYEHGGEVRTVIAYYTYYRK